MSEKMLWNNNHTESVKASKLRNISIYPDRHTMLGEKLHTEVKGWYNAQEYFDFGWFDTKEQAVYFVEQLNKQIEGGG